MNRRQALKSIALAPLALYLLGGAAPPEVPELRWYQTPHLENRKHKIGLKAIWPNGEQFGYVVLLLDVPGRLPQNGRGEIAFFPKDAHPAFTVAKDRLTRMALAKEVFGPDFYSPPIKAFPISVLKAL
ncbi:hypothetical protein LCGC14_2243230 [marine sediment metagenome]|uniref:Uncharacterized protein n=1 Tax=marine sediment metagenome TaxID=412755 RepID=A0A0F9D4Z0_9ZZZZ